jgi:hypothetical protein
MCVVAPLINLRRCKPHHGKDVGIRSYLDIVARKPQIVPVERRGGRDAAFRVKAMKRSRKQAGKRVCGPKQAKGAD